MTRRGLLIVNADDLGYDAPSTDAILDCHARGGVSSASAMVFMEDSERAAELARERGLPVGLHLNLGEPFSAEDVAADVRERQAELARYFRAGASHLMIWLPNPLVRGRVGRAIEDQLARFHELYGAPPTHVDGHRHLHLSPSVLCSRALARGTRVRKSFTLLPGEASAPSRAIRRARNAVIERRFRTTDWFFDFGHGDLQRKLDLARDASVELMTHPGLPEERPLLGSAEWSSRLAELPLGSFRDL